MVSSMEEADVRELLAKVCRRMPGLVLDVLDIVHKAPLPPSHAPPTPEDEMTWCTCDKCRDMPTAVEKVCCGLKPQHCLSSRPVSTTQYIHA